MRNHLLWKGLLLFFATLCLSFNGRAATRTVWVGQEFELECNPNAAASPWNVKWTYPSELLYNIGGSTLYNRFKVTQYFSGTAYVKCEWEDVYNAGFPGLESSVKRSNSWSITCQSNPVSILESDLSLAIGDTKQLHYQHKYENEYTSSAVTSFYCTETDVVSVTESGEVTAVGEGTAYVYLHSNISGVTPCCTVKVKGGNSDNVGDDKNEDGEENIEDDENRDNEDTVIEGNWTDFGNYDITWYNKTDKEFTISTAEEFAGVAYLVNNNITRFSGCTLHIVNNIDLQGRYWNPIWRFEGGVIEGNGHVIRADQKSDALQSGGLFTQIVDAKIYNIRVESNVSLTEGNNIKVGPFAGEIYGSTLKDIDIKSNLYIDDANYHDSDITLHTRIGGFAGYSKNSEYNNVNTETNFIVKLGEALGSSLYGNIELNIGGIIGYCEENNVFYKCRSINDVDLEINGCRGAYQDRNKYKSIVNYGGIIGYAENETIGKGIIESCFSKNINFNVYQNYRDDSSVTFKYGGIIGAEAGLFNRIQNCVALNTKYKLDRVNTTWSAFGGICSLSYSNSKLCYSNNDVEEILHTAVGIYRGGDYGSTSFSMSQMNSQAFVDEINFLNKLEFDAEPCWGLDENGNLILLSDEAMAVKDVLKDVEKTDAPIYNLQGIEMKDKNNLPKGIYIRGGKKFVVK